MSFANFAKALKGNSVAILVNQEELERQESEEETSGDRFRKFHRL
jgi:hypothetical protein